MTAISATKEYRRAKNRQYYWANREIYLEKNRRAAAAYQKYRQSLATSQDYLCPCGEPLVNGDGDLDHDHSCCPGHATRACRKCDRGVLHPSCNRGLGMLGDSPAKLRKLADYLERFAA
jgi:Recombination endonuclease VII